MDEMDKGDVEVIMVKIDIISGFLGAGKTTLIKGSAGRNPDRPDRKRIR